MIWKAGCIQMNIHYGNPAANKERAAEWIAKAAEQGCTVAVLPELWTTGYDLDRLDEIADPGGKEALEFLKALAVRHRIHIVGGSIAKKTEEGVKNTLFVIDSHGGLVHEYSKLHLFKLMDEHLHLEAGQEETLFSLSGEQAAGFICYDIRFPEWLRKPVLAGAKVLFVTAEWPAPRLDHWRTLLRARAIENQSYVVACNRSGEDPKNRFAGHSMIIGPWGEIIAEGGENEELVTGELDIDSIAEIRNRIPVFDDRRPDRYKN